MDRLKLLLAMMAAGGVMGVVVAVAVPLLVIAVRDRATDPTPVSGFPTSTPVTVAVLGGEAPATPPTSTPLPPAPTATSAAPADTATSEPDVPTATPSGTAGGDPEAGAQVFQSASPIACAVCHTFDGTDGLGPSFGPRPADAEPGIASRAGDRVSGLSGEEYMRQSILDPGAFLVPGFFDGLMPQTFSETLTAQQIEDVVAYLMTQ